MSRQADIAVYAPNGRILLVAEVKTKLGASAEWAAQMRQNLLMHAAIPNAPFFLLAFPDRFYLWKDGKLDAAPILPDYDIETVDLLASYIDRLGIPLATLSEPSLEMLVTAWLHDLVHVDFLQRDAHAWLFDSGLYEALKYGSVATEAIA